MRCSSCEPLLDRYIEGTLTPREMTRVTAHLHACPHCESLLTELRVVDALLATTAPMELAPNFTFAVMAEARST
ncbi:MAG: zf-HC2 domain-containing protein, partial [Candidatus Aquilonibacter sp.]